MTAVVLYVADRYLDTKTKIKVIETTKKCVCEGLHLDETHVTVALEAFEDENANERVAHCFFPVMYTPVGTPYAYKKKTGELLNERLRALIEEDNIMHCYFHMKEHNYEDVALNGRLLNFDDDAKEQIDKTRDENNTPWLAHTKGVCEK